MDINKAKETIRLMLNLANDPGAAEGEIANAMRFVNKLMAEHQLSDADLSHVDDKLMDLERKEMAKDWTYNFGHKKSEWEGSIAVLVCEMLGGVKCYITHPQLYKVNGIVQMHTGKWAHQAQTKPTTHFYGIAEDVAIAKELFSQIVFEIATLAKLKWGGIFRGPGREYCEGFASGMWSKFRNDKHSQKLLADQGTTSTSKSTALVAIESRGLIVKKKTELAEAYGEKVLKLKLRKGGGYSNSKAHNEQARAEGREDGQKRDLSAQRRAKLEGPKNRLSGPK